MKSRMSIWVFCLLCLSGLSFLSFWQQSFLNPTDIDEYQVASKDSHPIAPSVQEITSMPISVEWERTKEKTAISPVGVDQFNRMGVIEGLETTSWYQNGPIPGNAGNALIAGHRDWKGKLGSFHYLETIDQNERVKITYQDGESRTFVTVSKRVYSLDQIPSSVMDLSGETRVTLITCTGNFVREKGGYQKKIVVILYPLENERNKL